MALKNIPQKPDLELILSNTPFPKISFESFIANNNHSSKTGEKTIETKKSNNDPFNFPSFVEFLECHSTFDILSYSITSFPSLSKHRSSLIIYSKNSNISSKAITFSILIKENNSQKLNIASIKFGENGIKNFGCSCLHTEVSWCSHIVTLLLCLFEQRIFGAINGCPKIPEIHSKLSNSLAELIKHSIKKKGILKKVNKSLINEKTFLGLLENSGSFEMEVKKTFQISYLNSISFKAQADNYSTVKKKTRMDLKRSESIENSLLNKIFETFNGKNANIPRGDEKEVFDSVVFDGTVKYKTDAQKQIEMIDITSPSKYPLLNQQNKQKSIFNVEEENEIDVEKKQSMVEILSKGYIEKLSRMLQVYTEKKPKSGLHKTLNEKVEGENENFINTNCFKRKNNLFDENFDENKRSKLSKDVKQLDENAKEKEEEENYKDILKRAETNSFGLSKECCGCQCHKIAEEWNIKGKDICCRLCDNYHQKVDYLFKHVMENIFYKICRHIRFSEKNKHKKEMQRAAKIFERVSKFVVFVTGKMEDGNLWTTVAKNKISLIIRKIFSALFLSFQLNFKTYIKMVFLLRAWKQILPLEGVSMEGWFGRKTEMVLKRELRQISENKKTIGQRVFKLIEAERFVDALVYSCAVRDYKFVAICLGHLGRIKEAKEVIQLLHLNPTFINEIVKVFSECDIEEAFSTIEDCYTKIKKSENMKKIKKGLNWFIENAKNVSNGSARVEKLIKSLSFLSIEFLKEIFKKMFAEGIVEETNRVVFIEFFQKGRQISNEMKNWAVEKISMGKDKSLLSTVVDLVLAEEKFDPNLPFQADKLCQILENTDNIDLILPVGINVFSLMANKFKTQSGSKTRYFVPEYYFKLAEKQISLIFFKGIGSELNDKDGIGETMKEKLVPYLQSIFNVGDSSFTLKVLIFFSSVARSKNVRTNPAIRMGERLLEMQFSEPSQISCKILSWLLSEAFSNDRLGFAGHSNPKAFPEGTISAIFGLGSVKTVKNGGDIDLTNDCENNKNRSVSKEITSLESILKKTEDQVDVTSLRGVIICVATIIKKYGKKVTSEFLILVADFLQKHNLAPLNEILRLVIRTLSRNFKHKEKIESKAIGYFTLAKNSHPKTALKIAEEILENNPSAENYNRIFTLCNTKDITNENLENLEKEKDQQIIKQNSELNLNIKTEQKSNLSNLSNERSFEITIKEIKNRLFHKMSRPKTERRTKNGFKKSIEILEIFLREDAPEELVCKFLKRECSGFRNSEDALELLKGLLKTISGSEGGMEKHMTKNLWYCGVHFNVMVATLGGISLAAVRSFISFVESDCREVLSETLTSFSQAMSLLLEKKSAGLESKDLGEFLEYLSETKFLFEKIFQAKEWENLLERIIEAKRVNQPSIATALSDWKQRNCASAPMIILD